MLQQILSKRPASGITRNQSRLYGKRSGRGVIEKNSLKSTNYNRKKFAVEHELLAAEIRCRFNNRFYNSDNIDEAGLIK